SHAVRVDVRIVAATHRSLEAEVAGGRFRGDLFARLAAWQLAVPALRDRREDILLLAGELHARAAGRARLQLTANAAEALLLHDWPYNVRELEQVIATSAVRAGAGGVIRLEHLGPLAARLAGRCGRAAEPVEPEATPDRDALV